MNLFSLLTHYWKNLPDVEGISCCVCGEEEFLWVAKSSLGDWVDYYCIQCLEKNAEPEEEVVRGKTLPLKKDTTYWDRNDQKYVTITYEELVQLFKSTPPKKGSRKKGSKCETSVSGSKKT